MSDNHGDNRVECKHVWEGDVLKGHEQWHMCLKCMVLGQKDGDHIVPVRCVDCCGIATALEHRKVASPPMPVCYACFTGVVLS